MAIAEKPGWCNACNRQVLICRKQPSTLLHLVLTVATAGLWAPVWLLAVLGSSKWTCRLCGLPASARGRPGVA